jgi:PAS domain S-box-containing protein
MDAKIGGQNRGMGDRGKSDGAGDVTRYGLRVPAGVAGDDGIELSYHVPDTAPIGMAVTDEGGRFHWVNAALCRVAGRSKETLLSLRVADLLPSEERDKEERLVQRVFAGELGRFEHETWWTRGDGERVAVAVHASLATDPTGELLELGEQHAPALVRQVLDVTERKRAEQAVAQLGRELRQRNEELERSNAQLAEFAYVASHDLSEPLRVIAGHVALLRDRYQGQLDDDADRWIAFAVDGCARMRALIDDLLAYSRAGRTERPLRPTDCSDVVDRALWGLSVAADEASGEIQVEPLPTVIADDVQLVQLFSNLLANALKFRRPDRSPVVRVFASREDRAWRFVVADNAIGVPERHRERAFRLFQRLHPRETYTGTGLGLSIARKIVTRHGGEIWMEDGIDGGTAVCFTIPDRLQQGEG